VASEGIRTETSQTGKASLGSQPRINVSILEASVPCPAAAKSSRIKLQLKKIYKLFRDSLSYLAQRRLLYISA
jgi:hypothetical protein